MRLVIGACNISNFIVNLGDCGVYDFIDWKEVKGGWGEVKECKSDIK